MKIYRYGVESATALDSTTRRCCCCFSHSAYWLPTRENYLYGDQSRLCLLKRGNRRIQKSGRTPLPPYAAGTVEIKYNKTQGRYVNAPTTATATPSPLSLVPNEQQHSKKSEKQTDQHLRLQAIIPDTYPCKQHYTALHTRQLGWAPPTTASMPLGAYTTRSQNCLCVHSSMRPCRSAGPPPPPPQTCY